MKTAKRHILLSMVILAFVSFSSSCIEDPVVTELAPPTVTLGTPSVQQNSASLVCNVDGTSSFIKDCGFYFGKNQDMSGNKKLASTFSSSGSFQAKADGLTAGTTYYYTAFLSNGKDEIRSSVGSFTTLEGALPIVETMDIYDVGENEAGVKSRLKDEGGEFS